MGSFGLNMGKSKAKSTRPSSKGQAEADRQFDAGEISILRAYFRLPLRKSDPPLKTLYVEPDEEDAVAPEKRVPQRLRRPIRLVTCDSYGNVVSDLNHAVARICLSDVQRELPQWIDQSLDVPIYGRYRFETPKRAAPLRPEPLLKINWATSGFGVSWPELYCMTHIPQFRRCVVTLSTDSTDSWGVNDFALGWFDDGEGVIPASKRIILRWWRRLRDGSDQGAWEEASGYAIDEDEAWDMRHRVWPDADDDEGEDDWIPSSGSGPVAAVISEAGTDARPISGTATALPSGEANAWSVFEAHLADALGRLGDDDYLVISRIDAHRFVQFAGDDQGGLRAEAVSNGYLLDDEKLEEWQPDALVKAGWQPPTDEPDTPPEKMQPGGSPNFYVDLQPSNAAAAGAALAVRTLRDIFGATSPGNLEYQAFKSEGGDIDLDACFSGVCRKRGPDTDTQDEGTAVMVALVAAVRSAIRVPELELDEDGDIVMYAGSRPVILGWLPKVKLVLIRSQLVHGVQPSTQLLEELNRLHTSVAWTRFELRDAAIWATQFMPAPPVEEAHVAQMLTTFLANTADEDVRLQREFGGQIFGDEQSRKGGLH